GVTPHYLDDERVGDAHAFLSAIGILGYALATNTDPDSLDHFRWDNRPHRPRIYQGLRLIRAHLALGELMLLPQDVIRRIRQLHCYADVSHGFPFLNWFWPCGDRHIEEFPLSITGPSKGFLTFLAASAEEAHSRQMPISR